MLVFRPADPFSTPIDMPDILGSLPRTRQIDRQGAVTCPVQLFVCNFHPEHLAYVDCKLIVANCLPKAALGPSLLRVLFIKAVGPVKSALFFFCRRLEFVPSPFNERSMVIGVNVARARCVKVWCICRLLV